MKETVFLEKNWLDDRYYLYASGKVFMSSFASLEAAKDYAVWMGYRMQFKKPNPKNPSLTVLEWFS